MSRVYTVIVTYNGRKWIDKCLESLYKSSIQNNVIIVDNNSEDDTVGYINKKFPDAVVLIQNKNLGFGKANNIGISYALQNGADFVFLLNQDTHIEKNTLEKLVDLSKKHSEYGILSPFQFNWDGSQLEYYFSKFILKNLEIYSDFILSKQLKPVYEVPFVNAAAWLIPKTILKKIGGFDPIFHHYGEDNNYCQRVNFHNYKIGVVPEARIFHDSKKRKAPDDYLFTEAYYLQEVKKFQIKYANINNPYLEKDLKKELKHIRKLIFINILRLNGQAVRGYLKKSKIFEKNIERIMQSRRQNALEKAHYLIF